MSPSERTPFDEDNAALAAADRLGFELVRLPAKVVVEDLALIPIKFLKMQPDKAAIRRAIENGISVPGARLDAEGYMLVPREKGRGAVVGDGGTDRVHGDSHSPVPPD